jgi:phage-related protein
MWEIEFFITDNGRCPTKDYFEELSEKKDLPYILNALDQLSEHGYKLDRPKAAFLRDEIYELRVKTINGQFRFLYFFFDGNRIIVTHGFKKKIRKVQTKDIEKAKEYRKIYYLRKGVKP